MEKNYIDSKFSNIFLKRLRTFVFLTFCMLSYVTVFAQFGADGLSSDNGDFRLIYLNPLDVEAQNTTGTTNEFALRSLRGASSPQALHSLIVTVQLPPGINYTAGSFNITNNNNGGGTFVLAEHDITNLNAPQFSIYNNGIATDVWDAGDDVYFTIERTAGCAAVTYKEAGNSFKDYVSLSYINSGSGAQTATDINPLIGNYDLLAASLSVEAIAPVNGIVGGGNVHSRSLSDVNGGNAGISQGQHIVTIGADVLNYTLSYNGTLLTPNGTSTATMLVYDYDLTVAPFNVATANEDGDGVFEGGEKLTFDETFELTDCADTTIEHSTQWTCQTSQITTGNVLFGANSPNLTITVLENHQNIAQTNHIRLEITNTGTGTEAWAQDILLNMALGSNGQSATTTYNNNPHWAFDYLDTRAYSNFTLGDGTTQIAFTPENWASDNYPTRGSGFTYAMLPDTNIGVDIDGVGGLTDLDSDGYFDDLAPGASFVIEFDYDNTANINCGIGRFDYIGWEHLFVDAIAKDQCGAARPTVGTDLGYRNFIRDYSVPTLTEQDTDILELQPFEVAVEPYLYAGFNHNDHAMLNSNADNEFTVSIVVPRGVDLIPTLGFAQTTSGYTPGVPGAGTNTITYTTTNIQSGYTVAQDFADGYVRFPLIMNCFELEDMGGINNTINISYQTNLKLYDTPGGTVLLDRDIHCGDFESIIEHSCNEPCQGPNITGLDAYRITAGWTDNTMTTKVDLTTGGFELNKYLAGDEMMVETTGYMHNIMSNNLFFRQNFTTDGTTSGADDIEFIEGTIRINKSDGLGGFTSTAVTTFTTAPTISSSGNNHNLDFDLSFILADPILAGLVQGGTTALSRDTFEVSFKYRFTTETYTNYNYHKLSNFRGQYYMIETLPASVSGAALDNDNDDDGTPDETISCYDWGDEIGYLRPTLIPSSSTSSFKYCETPELIVYNDYYRANAPHLHPGEYRPVTAIQSVQVTIPEGLIVTDMYQQNNQGNFSVSAGHIDISPALGTPGVSTYTLTPNRTAGYRDADQTATASWRLRIVSQGSCELKQGSDGLPFPRISTTTVSQLMAYTDVPIAAQLLTQTPYRDIDYLKPIFIIQPLLSSTVVGHSPEADFDIQVINNSAVGGDTDFNWIKVPATANITVTGAEDITGASIPLNVVTTGAGDAYVEIGSLAVGGLKNIRIKATYDSCTDIPVDFQLGWNCTSYPPDYNAVINACYDNTTQLTLQPALAQIQQSITSQPSGAQDLCTDFVVETEYLSAQPGTIVNPVASIQVFNGVGALLVNLVEVEYPAGSGIWQDVTANVTTPTANLYSVPITHPNMVVYGGLPGTGAVGATAADRTANVRFTLQGTCDFVSNSALSFIINGDKTCGDPALGNGGRSLTDGIQINGLSATYDALSTITLPGLSDPGGGHIDGCSAQETINIQTTIAEFIAGSGVTTGTSDFGRVDLPLGVTYVNGTFNNLGINVVTLVSSTANQLIIHYPAGLGDTDLTEFEFDIVPDAGYCEENAEVSFTNYIEVDPGVSCGGSGCPTGLISTGSTREDLDINKAAVAINLDSAIASVTFADEQITASFTIDNNSAIDVTPPSVIKAFYDANGDGVYDAGDIELGSHDVTATIPAGGSVSESISFTATPQQACNILLVMNVDDNPCICLPASVDMGSPTVLTGIGGSDVPVCETFESVELGTTANPDYTYSWAGASALEDGYLDNVNVAQPNFTYSGASLSAVTTFTYTVTITRPGGCTSTDTVDVTVNPSPESPSVSSSDVDVCSIEYMTVSFGNTLAANEVIKVWKNAALTTPANDPNTNGIWTSTELFAAGAGSLWATVENTVTSCRSAAVEIPYVITEIGRAHV